MKLALACLFVAGSAAAAPIKVAVFPNYATAGQYVVNQLSADSNLEVTGFDNPWELDQAWKLAAFDVIVLGDGGTHNSTYGWSVMAGALKEYVSAGGGLVMTAWGVYYGFPPDLDDLIPVARGSGCECDYYGTINILDPTHPITQGLSDFVAPRNQNTGNPKQGALVLGISNSQQSEAAIATWTYGLGHVVHLSPMYMADRSAYPEDLSGLTTGAPDQLLRQAVEYAGAPATPTDVTAPVLRTPQRLTVEATSADGAHVLWLERATDDADAHPSVTCTPASGSLFAIGLTTVACTATDAAGRTTTGTFPLRVLPQGGSVEVASYPMRGGTATSDGSQPIPDTCYVDDTFGNEIGAPGLHGVDLPQVTLHASDSGSTIVFDATNTPNFAEVVAKLVSQSPEHVTYNSQYTNYPTGSANTLVEWSNGVVQDVSRFVFEVDDVHFGGTSPDGFHVIYSLTGSMHISAFVPNDWSIALSPATRAIAAGSSADYTVTTQVTSGSAEQIELAVSGLPDGVTGSFSPGTVGAGEASTLTLQSASSAPAASAHTFTLTGTSASATHGATAQVSVPHNDFSLSPAPTHLTLSPGGSATVAVTTAATVGVAETITFSLTGLPAHASFAFNPASVAAGGSSTLTLTADEGLTASQPALTIHGVAASANHTATVSLSALQAPTVQLTAPAAGEVSGQVSLAAHASVSPGTTLASIELLADGAVVSTASTATASATWDSTAVADGAHVLSARATDAAGNVGHAAEVSVTVHNHGFTLAVTPATATLSPGGTATYTVATSPTAGTTDTIALSVAGQPDGTTAAFSPAAVAAGQSATLTISAGASLRAAQATLTITGASASETHTATAALSALQAPSVQLTAPAAGEVSGTVTLGATATVSPGTTLATLQLLVDGAIVGSGSASPASAAWDSTRAAEGPHTLSAVATDAAGNSGRSAEVAVTVKNNATVKSGGCSSAGGSLTALGLLACALLRRRRRWTLAAERACGAAPGGALLRDATDRTREPDRR